MTATQPMGRGRCARTRRGPARRPALAHCRSLGPGKGRRVRGAALPPSSRPRPGLCGRWRRAERGGERRGGARCGRRDEAAAGAGVGQGVHPARLQRRHALPVPEQVPGRAGEPGEGRGGGGAASPGPVPRRAVPRPRGSRRLWGAGRGRAPPRGRCRSVGTGTGGDNAWEAAAAGPRRRAIPAQHSRVWWPRSRRGALAPREWRLPCGTALSGSAGAVPAREDRLRGLPLA